MPRIRRSNPENLPPRVYLKHGAYYYVTLAGKWEGLGKEWNLAARTKWAEFAGEAAPEGSFRELVTLWKEEVLPTRARRTQDSNEEELKNILPVFGPCAVDEITLPMMRKYLKLRGKKAKVRANRETTLVSQIYRWGMNEGYARHNPCDGLIKHKETPRSRLVTDSELERFLAFARGASPIIAAVMRLMYVTCQRRVDLLALRLPAIHPDGLELIQSKTGAKLLIEWSDELRAAVDEILQVHKAAMAKRKVAALTLICTRQGQPYTDAGIKSMFNRTMVDAVDREHGPPALIDRFRMQDMRPKAVSDVGGGKRGKDLAGHRIQATTDRVYDRVTFKRVKPTK